MASRLESLPDEVLLAVLGRLGDGDLARVRLLSGRIRAVARSARWEAVSANKHGATAPRIDALVRAIERGAFSRVGRLIVRRDGDGPGALRVLHAAAASRMDVRTLALHAVDAVGLLAAFLILAAAPLRPRRLELAVDGYLGGSFGAIAASFAGALPSVVELELRAARGLSPDALAELFGATPGVESLFIENASSSAAPWYHPPPSSPFRALEALPRIASLRIRDPRWFTAVGAGVAAVPVRASVALLHLDVDAEGWQLERAAGLARRTTRVRSLRVDPEGLAAVLGAAPGLEIERELDIRRFDAADAARALALARWIPSVRFGFGASLYISCPLHIDSILAIAVAARDAIDRNSMIHYNRTMYSLDISLAPRELGVLFGRAEGASIDASVRYAIRAADLEGGAVLAALEPLAAIAEHARAAERCLHRLHVILVCSVLHTNDVRAELSALRARSGWPEERLAFTVTY